MDNSKENNGIKQFEHQKILPPPKISKDQAEKLIQKILGDEPTSGKKNENASQVSLQGRPVMIPFGKCAFYEGELQPNKIVSSTKASTADGTVSTDNDKAIPEQSSEVVDEEVYITASVEDGQ